MIGRILKSPLFYLLPLIAIALLLPEFAHATPQQPGATNCSSYVGITNKIASCIRATLDNTADTFFVVFYPIVSRAITAMMTLAVIVFGAMAAYGMLEKVGRDSIMLLLKIAMVSWFTTNTDYMYHSVLDMMDDTATAVLTYVPSSGPLNNSGDDYSQVKCMKNMHDAQSNSSGNPGAPGPWVAMDCLIDTIIGIHMPTTTNNNAQSPIKAFNDQLNNADQGPSRGMIYLFFSSLTSVMGIGLAIIGFIFLRGMVSLIIKALFIYLAGYLGLAVLMMFAPMFIPLVLFQSTKSYFDKWVKLIISFSLQPIIILVFVMFTITAVDLATFSGDYSVFYRVAGDASRQQGFTLNGYLTCPRSSGNPTQCLPANTNPLPADAFALIAKTNLEYGRVKSTGNDTNIDIIQNTNDSVINNLGNSKCTKALMDADPNVKKACDQSYSLFIQQDSMNWQNMAAARVPTVQVPTAQQGQPQVTPAQQIAREVLASLIFAALVVYIMNRLLSVIPSVAYDLTGDFGSSPNLAKSMGVVPGTDKMRSAMEGMVTNRR